jgi:hypothetical protein
MNGMHPSQPEPTRQSYPAMSETTPLAVYTPVAITAGTIKWFLGGVLGLIAFLAGTPIAERYMMPAKDSDLKSLVAIVDTMRNDLKESREAISRLTQAVDNLSGIVNSMKLATAPITKARR